LNRCLVILALLMAAGCARFHPQPLSPADTATSLDARRLDDPGLRQFVETNAGHTIPDWPPQKWDFESLTLAAFYYHPSLDVARAQWAVATAGDKTAAARPNPVLSAVPGWSFDPASGSVYTPWLPAVSLDIPIETAGKRGDRIAQSRHLSDAARLDLITAAWQVRANLRSALMDFSSAQKREAILQRQVDLQDRVVRATEQQFQAGAVSTSDLTQARIVRDKTRLDWLDAQSLAAGSRARVAEAIGISVAALEGVELADDPFPDVPAGRMLSAEARRAALSGRSDILAALAEYEASQSALQLEVARQYPDVHLGPGYQYDQGNQILTIGLSAELPILNQNQGPIAEAKARRAAAAANFLQLQAKVMNEIDSAVEEYRAASQQMLTLQSLEEAQAHQRQAVEDQVRAGEAADLDAVNARAEEGTAELAALDGRLKAQQALGALEDAMQRPIDNLKPASIEQAPRPQARKENQP
jgi:cobalt-zinc-cadmium efflux system outer membrane protein